MLRRNALKAFGSYELIIPSAAHQKVPFSGPRSVPSFIARPDYSNLAALADRKEIKIFKQKEIDAMKRVGEIARETLDYVSSKTIIGITTLDLDEIVHEFIIGKGAYPSPLMYHNFPRSCCTSVNNILCHGIPDSRPLKDGDIVNIDITCYFGGYHGDTSRTIEIGKVDQKGIDLVEATKIALQVGIDVVGPGVKFSSIGLEISKYAEGLGFGVDDAFCGHGIGENFHMPPLVQHCKNNEKDIMREGMIFTIEPIFVQGMTGFRKWDDDWTACTLDGGRAAQFEHTILVTSYGSQILT